jgi:serine protease Do
MIFGAENVGFALPINNAKRTLQELKEFGRIRHPFLGIRYILIDEEMRKKHSLPCSSGALIVTESSSKQEAVIPGSPAHKTGLKEGDIITEAENQKISEENTLEDILHSFKIGEKISLKIIRGKNKIQTKIEIGYM